MDYIAWLLEAMWLQDPRCAEVVQDAWMDGLCKTGAPQLITVLTVAGHG